MKKKSRAWANGITLVALVITIVVLLILAGITIMYVMGDNGVFGRASQAKVQTELGKIEERAQMIYSDKLMVSSSSSLNTKVETSEVISQLISEGYNNIKKRPTGENGITEISLDKESITIGFGKTAEIHINYKDTSGSDYYVEVQGKYYEMHSNKGFITIDREASTLTKADFEKEGDGTTPTLTVTSSKPAVATAKLKEKSDDTIEVTALNVEDSTEITVTYGKFAPLKCIVTVTTLEIEEAKAFSRAIGVIDIVWLDTENNVIEQPISPKGSLGNLTAIKYDGTNWVRADEDNKKNADGKNDWYDYVAQTEKTESGGTSQWANAVANFTGTDKEKAYFVWIPRYAYKITYFKEKTDAEAYRTDRNSKKGIIGYSNINGLVDVSTGVEKLVKGSEPINLAKTGNEINKVKSTEYADYIPHPAFEFGGAKAGIWVGKFESSGSTSKVTIIPNTTTLRSITESSMFTACQEVKKTYSLAGDSHLMKNTEWGAVAYLADSKYGRNGTAIKRNSSTYITGGGTNDAYKTNTNVLQSTTGNIYGIYDMNGGSWEYVAGYVNNSTVSSNGQNTDLVNAVAKDSKYADVYTVGSPDNQANNYNNAKGMKGDSVFETSTAGSNTTSWNSYYSGFPQARGPAFKRGRLLR